jgi:hypothetical protein
MGEEFYLDGEELNNESQLTIFDKTKLKLIEAMEQKLKECKDNINYSEKGDFETNLTIVTKHLSAIASVVELDYHKEKLNDDEITEALEKIQKSVKELSFNDLKEIEKKKNVEVEQSNNESSKGEDFDF